MRINREGLDIIKHNEGLRLEAYRDAVGIWTIGYGHTDGVKPGQRITQLEAEKLLKDDITWAEGAVQNTVHVPLTSNQYSALVSLIFNIGVTAFRASTMAILLNQRRYQEAAEQFMRWTYAKGRHLKGLFNRRMQEQALFRK